MHDTAEKPTVAICLEYVPYPASSFERFNAFEDCQVSPVYTTGVAYKVPVEERMGNLERSQDIRAVPITENCPEMPRALRREKTPRR